MKNGILRVGIDDAPPVPMQMGDPVAGTCRGYEVDLLELVVDRLGCTNEFRRAWWSLITEELVSGKLDRVRSAATVTELRKNEVSFYEPHLWIKLALVERQNTTDFAGRESPCFGVRRGTTAEEFLRTTLGHEPVMQSESNDELYQALSKGHIDAVIDDSPIGKHFADSTGGLHYSGAYAMSALACCHQPRQRMLYLRCGNARSAKAKLFQVEFPDLHVSREDSIEPWCDQLKRQFFEAEYPALAILQQLA